MKATIFTKANTLEPQGINKRDELYLYIMYVFFFVILPFQIFSDMFYLSGVKYKSIVTSTATVMHSDMISANFQFHFHQVLQTFLFSLIQTTVQEGVLLFFDRKGSV